MSQKLPARSETAPPPAGRSPAVDKGDLPEGWVVAKVGALFKVSSGGTPSKHEPLYWNGEIPWLSSGDIKTDEIDCGSDFITQAGLKNSSAKLCNPGAVVVVVRSGILKHTLPVAVLRRPCAINQDIRSFDAGDTGLNRWLAVALRASAQSILAENREGTTVQSVTSETLRDFQLSLPPLAEQRRIVGKLEAVLGKVSASRERLARVPGLLKRFRQSVLAAACSGKLTADWREGYEDADWSEVLLSEIGDVSGGLTKNAKRPSLPLQVPYLRVANVYSNCLRLDDVQMIGVSESELNRTLLKRDDILFVEGNGSLDQIGRVAQWTGEVAKCVHQNHLIKFRAGADVLASFILYYMMSPDGRTKLMEQAISSAGLHSLSISKIEMIVVPLPPLAEQQEIVRRVERLFALADRLEAQLRAAQTRVDKLTQAVLAKAFRGELVPTEADLARHEARPYEPAHELLARIREQQTTTKPAKAPRKPQK